MLGSDPEAIDATLPHDMPGIGRSTPGLVAKSASLAATAGSMRLRVSKGDRSGPVAPASVWD